MSTPSNDPSNSSDDVLINSDDLLEQLTDNFRSSAKDVVPWFVANMPQTYLLDSTPEERLNHLQAIMAARSSGQELNVRIRSADGLQLTIMAPSNYPGLLARTLRALPQDRPLLSAKTHSALDNSLVIVAFRFGEQTAFDIQEPSQAQKIAEILDYAHEHDIEIDQVELVEYLNRCPEEYVATLTPLRFLRQWEYFKEVCGSEDVAVHLEDEELASQSRIVIVTGNCQARRLFTRVAQVLGRAKVHVDRAYLDRVDDGEGGAVTFMGFVVHNAEGGSIVENEETWRSLRRNLQRVKWLDQFTLDLAERHEALSLTRAEILMALCHLSHQILCKVDRDAFTRDHIVRHAEKNLEISNSLVDLYLLRFNVERPLPEKDFQKVCQDIEERIEAQVDLAAAKTTLLQILASMKAVLRTNVFIRSRYGLSMRIDPALLKNDDRPELPFGVFFVHGRSFNGFHVRFRDISRGGVRCVRTIGNEQHAREVEGLYDEVYNLAFAQQLKNKDIPEGGSKAVILLEPDTPVERCVRSFVDGLLDLLTPDPEIKNRVVDLYGHEEWLYLGPDENITPDHIVWIVERAAKRGYPCPSALMSSKPGGGINHKTYGVTSEGVTVFLDSALRHIGIDPDLEEFSVKITGGPDGDVAGNEIRILNRDYGNRAKILGIADGSGSGEDPDGLDHDELLRLFNEALPIASFDRAKLGPKGRVTGVDEDDGVMLRNSLHNRIVADAFIPAGGRPATIHADNWQEFLLPDGKPSSPLIVEGANLFLTPAARTHLHHAGCLIVKDSSANKCGVITSSFEISACMHLSEAEFIAIKDDFVEQVLLRLRSKARAEAELLFRLNLYHPDMPLPELSVKMSRAIIRTADAIELHLSEIEAEAPNEVRRVVFDHLPEILVSTVGETKIWNNTPKAYLGSIISKSLATRIIYREGHKYLELMSPEAIGKMAANYLKLESERYLLMKQAKTLGNFDGERIAELLDQAGILSTMGRKGR